MLLPHLYKIISCTQTGEFIFEFIAEINPGDAIFAGHFPGRPILPGVCTIQIVKECIASVTKEEGHFMNIAQCKFMGMVDPDLDNKLIITISLTDDGSGARVVSASINNYNRVVCRIKATLT